MNVFQQRRALTIAAIASFSFIALLAPNQASATTIVLDLAMLSPGPFSAPISIDGFTLTPQLGGSSTPTIGFDYNGVAVLGSTADVFAGGADTFLTKDDGGVFSILSVGLEALNGDGGSFGIGISSVTPSVAGVTYGANWGTPLPFVSLETFDTTGYLTNVTAVDFDPVDLGDGDVIGNIVISYDDATDVPEPASLGVLALGAAATVIGRRRPRR